MVFRVARLHFSLPFLFSHPHPQVQVKIAALVFITGDFWDVYIENRQEWHKPVCKQFILRVFLFSFRFLLMYITNGIVQEEISTRS